MHNFFSDITQFPELIPFCKTDITDLPEAYKGKKSIKAILLGADPTNNGIKTKQELIELNVVFGIGSQYEKYFFAPQKVNLKAINLDIENLYIQNVSRCYFEEQTAKNNKWPVLARLWLKYLVEELEAIDSSIPVLTTAERITKVLCEKVPPAKVMYESPDRFLPLQSTILKRDIYPLYRNPNYYLSKNYAYYKDFLKEKLHV
jgi:hypothetical protein